MTPGRLRLAAIAANGLLALSILLLPWYALDDYVPSGWDATDAAKLALVCAVANVVLIRVRGSASRVLAIAALLLVALRVAHPPDFGFDFDGLEVPTERRFGCWVGLGSAVMAAALALVPHPRVSESA